MNIYYNTHQYIKKKYHQVFISRSMCERRKKGTAREMVRMDHILAHSTAVEIDNVSKQII